MNSSTTTAGLGRFEGGVRQGHRSVFHRLAALATACFAILIVFALPAVEAGTVAVSIAGNNVTYSASGLPAETDVTVTIQNGTSGSSTQQAATTSKSGKIPPSTGTTGDDIEGGTTVTVTVTDEEGNVLASGSATKKVSKVGKVIDAIVKAIKWLF